MMNEKQRAKREQDKIREVARDYQKRGYVVTLEPTFEVLPEFFRDLGYRPDMILKTEEGNHIVVEVKTSASLKRVATKLAELSNVLQEQKNWDFELILTNPRTEVEEQFSVGSDNIDNFANALERAKQLLDAAESPQNYNDAVLMITWSAVEGIIRVILSNDEKEKPLRKPRTLIRDAAILGIIEPEDVAFLEEISRIRNKVAHGDFNQQIDVEQINKLLDVGKYLLSQM